MGVCYEQLASKFGASIPAIGFACEVEALIQAISDQEITSAPIDFTIIYEKELITDSIVVASRLREQEYKVLSLKSGKAVELHSLYTIHMKQDRHTIQGQGKIENFSDINELLKWIKEGGL